jgi:multicomponent Na+:H+ antiporter subunit A
LLTIINYCTLFLISLALFILLLNKISAKWIGLYLAFTACVIFVAGCGLFASLTSKPILSTTIVDWFPALHLSLSYYIDGLSLLFVLLISGVGALIFFYAHVYMRDAANKKAFFAYLTLFMGAMLGLVTADNLLLVFIYWELTSISSYLLIGFQHENPKARQAALQGIMITVVGGLGLLVACIMVLAASGTLNISTLLARPALLPQGIYLNIIVVLLLFAAFTKSAQFPFHYWLPGAMQAPTPVSAYLHSAAMVNAGIYLIARLHPILTASPLGSTLLVTAGLITMLVGGWLALKEHDLKLILAYTTVYALGSMVYLLAGNDALAIKAALTFIVVHVLYKASLFMLAGFIDKSYNTRDIRQLNGLWRFSPIAAITLLIGAGSMLSLPPLFGFLSKQIAFEAKFMKSSIMWPVEVVSLTAGFLVAMQGIRLCQIIFGTASTQPNTHYVRTWMVWGPALLAAITLLFGLAPQLLEQSGLLNIATFDVIPTTALPVSLDDLSPWSLSGLFSLLIFLGGILFYCCRTPINKLANRLAAIELIGPANIADKCLNNLPIAANKIAAFIQNGNLTFYISTLWVFLLIVVWGYWHAPILPALMQGLNITTQHIYSGDFVIAALVIIASGMVIFVESTITALILLGILGLGSALIFLVHGAPDVAMTQILIELLTVVFFVLNLYRLPTLKDNLKSSFTNNIVPIIISLLIGVMITGIMLSIVNKNLPDYVSHYYILNSLIKAHGANVVNVIIVDFRALDTLGEIIVIMAAAIGVLGLIRSYGLASHFNASWISTVTLKRSSNVILQIMIIFSVFMLLRGHNQIGGGFIGGLVAASALTLFHIAKERAHSTFVLKNWYWLLVAGLLLIIFSLIAALTVHLPALTGLWLEFTALGSVIKIGTPFIFDIGVYIIVLAAVALMLSVLEE